MLRLELVNVEIDRLKKYHNDSLKLKRDTRHEVFKAQCDRRDLEDQVLYATASQVRINCAQ